MCIRDSYKAPDYETIIAGAPTLAIFSTMLTSVPDVAEKLKELEINYILGAHFSNGSGMRAREVYSFSSETKYSGAVMNDGKSYVIGAPEFVLRGQFAPVSYTHLIFLIVFLQWLI